MNANRLRAMFDIAQDLYRDEQKKSGMVDPIPFAWARNDETGELIIYSAFQKDSVGIMQKLGIRQKGEPRFRHTQIPCSEFLCLPEMNPHHYEEFPEPPSVEHLATGR